MKKSRLLLLAALLSISSHTQAATSNSALTGFSHETAMLICRSDTYILLNSVTSENLDLTGKNCIQALSYIKNRAEYPFEHFKTDHYVLRHNVNHELFLEHFYIEYLRKKT